MPRTRVTRGTVGVLAGLKLVLNTAHRFVHPFLPALARGLGISLEQAGVLVSVRWIAGLTTPVVVRAVGKANHRRLLVGALASFSVGAGLTAWLGVFAAALIGFVLMGVAKPTYDIASQAYVSDRVPYERRAFYLGLLELTWAGGILIGAPVVGWLIEIGTWRTPFWVLGGLAALGLIVLPRFVDPDRPVSDGRLAPDPSRAGRALFAVAALVSAGSELVFVVLGAWLEASFGLSLIALGGVAASIGVAELVGEGTNLAFTDRMGKRRAVVFGLAGAIVGYVGLASMSASLVPGVIALLVGVTAFEFAFVATIALASDQRPASRSSYLAWFVVAVALGRAAADLIGPRLFRTGGVSQVAAVAALVTAVGLVILVGWVKERPAAADHSPGTL